MTDKGKHGKGDQRQREKNNRGNAYDIGDAVTLRIRRNLIGARNRGAAALVFIFQIKHKGDNCRNQQQDSDDGSLRKIKQSDDLTIHIYRKSDGFPTDDKRYTVVGEYHREDRKYNADQRALDIGQRNGEELLALG